ncbi:MAG: MoaD/ThiS family protein [Bacillota bacterium]
MITVKLMSDMYLYSPTGENTLMIAHPVKNLREVLDAIKLTGEEVGLVIINGEVQPLNRGLEIPIQDRAVIEIYPFIGGG